MQYELKSGGFTAAVDSLGAQLVSLKGPEGFEHLWVGDPKYWTGHAPVLFPIVGALRNGRARIGGEWFEMGQHGFARRREFSLESREENRVSLVLRDSEETREQYPFPFLLRVSYTLTGGSVETRFTVENPGQADLPFAIGGHPGFNIPVDEDAAFEDYTIRFEKPEDQSCPAIDLSQALIDPSACSYELHGTEIPLAHSLFYHDALIFEDLNSHKVQIVNKKTGRGVEMDFSGFPLLGIWSAQNDGPYVCLEPWIGCATRTDEGDDFEEKHRLIFLPAGEKREYAFTASLLL